jgi:hypothetical protein
MSTTFDINDEIDRIVEKLAVDLKCRLKKAVSRNDKIILKKITNSQKSTKPTTLLPSSKRKSSCRKTKQKERDGESESSESD